MSSNMYGFEFFFNWNNREYFGQMVYIGSGYDDPMTIKDWMDDNPIELAKQELKNRVWPNGKPIRLKVSSINAYWLDTDDPKKPDGTKDYSWNPPVPSEQIILSLIVEGKAELGMVGWDT